MSQNTLKNAPLKPSGSGLLSVFRWSGYHLLDFFIVGDSHKFCVLFRFYFPDKVAICYRIIFFFLEEILKVLQASLLYIYHRDHGSTPFPNQFVYGVC